MDRTHGNHRQPAWICYWFCLTSRSHRAFLIRPAESIYMWSKYSLPIPPITKNEKISPYDLLNRLVCHAHFSTFPAVVRDLSGARKSNHGKNAPEEHQERPRQYKEPICDGLAVLTSQIVIHPHKGVIRQQCDESWEQDKTNGHIDIFYALRGGFRFLFKTKPRYTGSDQGGDTQYHHFFILIPHFLINRRNMTNR